jgi:hypothetical protein
MTRDAAWGLPDPEDDQFEDADDQALLDPEDRDWLTEWYAEQDATADRHEHRVAVAETEGRPPSRSEEDNQEALTKLDVLRRALLDSKGLDHLASPRALIDHILYFDTPSWIIGRPGCGKSFVALDWAGHVGSGICWNGFQTVQTNVIYVSPESPGGVKLRKQAWEASQGHRMDGVYFLPLPINAINAGEFSALAALALEVHAGLIILDTQARMTVGLEENSSKDMGVFVDKLDRLRDRTHACILTVHHTPRGADHLRGSTALEGAAGTIITVKKTGDEIVLSADPEHGGKTKDVAPFEDVQLRLVAYADAAIVTELAQDHPGDREIPTDVGRSLRAWWQQHGSEPVSPSLIIRTEIMAERTFHRYKKMLIDQGVLVKTGRGNQTRYAVREGCPYAVDSP